MRTQHLFRDTSGYLPRHDKDLIDEAHKQCWEDIEPERAETKEARQILHRIAMRKYHIDEAKAGMI